MNRRKIGDSGEHAVCLFLESKGYEILERNYTIRGGEIDIIARKDDIVIFCEVKSRKKDTLISGIEAVDRNKRSHIVKTAVNYINKKECEYQPRFDIALVTVSDDIVTEIKYMENAYDISDTNIIY